MGHKYTSTEERLLKHHFEQDNRLDFSHILSGFRFDNGDFRVVYELSSLHSITFYYDVVNFSWTMVQETNIEPDNFFVFP